VDVYVHSTIETMGSWNLDTVADIVCSYAGGAIGDLAFRKLRAKPPPSEAGG
jgi:hypothetical protein